MNKKKIAIVGGGITGASAAYYLQKEINEKQLPYEMKLVEASDRLGGKIKTKRQEGFTIEQGPDSLLARKPAALKLIKELGLEDSVIRNGTGQSYILVNNKLYKMPQGTFMGVPKQIRSLMYSKLLSGGGKRRALMELILPKQKKKEDQSLGGFLRRRFGNEIVDKQMDPLLSGIHSGDLDQMSLMATHAEFYQLEQQYGSLIKGLHKTKPEVKKKKDQSKTGAFISLLGGLETLVEKLYEKLDKNAVMLGRAVDHIEKKEQGYHLLLSSGEVLTADAVIMATPHQKVPKIFSQYDFFRTLYDIPATSTANVALAFDQSAIKKDVDGTGFLVSKTSDYRITACTWTHKKWPETTPDGKVLLRSYVGKPNDQEIVDLSDEEIEQIVLNDLKKIMKIKGQPEFSVITRWRHARPQYNVGHLERVQSVRDKVSANLPGVFLVGNSYDSVGIPDCINQGEKAVVDVLRFINE